MFNFILGFAVGATVAHFIPPVVMFELAKKGWAKLVELFNNFTKVK